MEIKKYRILSIDAPVPEVKVFRIAPIEGNVPAFLPGQFVFLHLLDESGASVVRRPYSVASSPSMPYLEFAIEMVGGQMTGRLAKARPGDTLGVEGPAGHMVYRNERKAAFVAGGTGISPFMSMLRSISEKKLPGRFVLFLSARTRDQVLFSKELEKIQASHDGIKVIVTLTREVPEGWGGECGRLNHEMLIKHLPDAREFDWWVCGSPGLVKAVRECLSLLAVDMKRLKLEGWG